MSRLPAFQPAQLPSFTPTPLGLPLDYEPFGSIDLSRELAPDQRGFKALNWWREPNGTLHALLAVGVVALPLVQGYESMAEQFAEALPDLPKGVKVMDVFAVKGLTSPRWMDFAGVYLGCVRPAHGLLSATAAQMLLETSPIGLRRDAVNTLWGLWHASPYACATPEEEQRGRSVQTAHRLQHGANGFVLEDAPIAMLD